MSWSLNIILKHGLGDACLRKPDNSGFFGVPFNIEEACREMDAVHSDLQLAIQYLREGKVKFTPGTANSFVDDLIAKYSDKETK